MFVSILCFQTCLVRYQYIFFQPSLPPNCSQLFSRMLKGSAKQKYKEELRTFAITLSFYSTKAYNYVSEKSHYLTISTVTKWFQSVDGSLGFKRQSLEALRVKAAENKIRNKVTVCNLVLDEMSVMKRIQWTGKKCRVMLIRAWALSQMKFQRLLKSFYLLNGYFFINGLNGTKKANLVNRALEFIAETGIIVSSLIFDGGPSNVSMVSILGADLTHPASLKTYFMYPVNNYKIYMFLDICHVLKLVRNSLASQKNLKDADDELISWHYLTP
nr:unnamed protein product [Callosobruchus analis]